MAKPTNSPSTAAAPPTCTYKGQTYQSGAYICIEGKCQQCQNGSWVDSGHECAPGEDGQTCTPSVAPGGAASMVVEPAPAIVTSAEPVAESAPKKPAKGKAKVAKPAKAQPGKAASAKGKAVKGKAAKAQPAKAQPAKAQPAKAAAKPAKKAAKVAKKAGKAPAKKAGKKAGKKAAKVAGKPAKKSAGKKAKKSATKPKRK